MANTVRFLLTADDKVTGTLGKVEDKFKRVGVSGVAMGVGIAGGVMAFNAIKGAVIGAVGAIDDAVKAAADEEAAIATLNRAIAENDKAWDGNIDKVEGVLKSRIALAYSDDEQRDSLRTLVSVTQDVNKALDIQRTAMDLARLRGMSLEDATMLLGKVYAGNIGILKRYGIAVGDIKDPTEAIIEVQRRAQGQAETYADTLAGKLTVAQLRFNEAQEDFGRAAMPAAEAALDAMGKLFTGLNWLMDENLRDETDNARMRTRLAKATTDEVIAIAENEGATIANRAIAWAELNRRRGEEAGGSYTEAYAGALWRARSTLVDAGEEVAGGVVEGFIEELGDSGDDVQRAVQSLFKAAFAPVDAESRIAELAGWAVGIAAAVGMGKAAKDPYFMAQVGKATGEIKSEFEAIKSWMYSSGYNATKQWSLGLASKSALTAVTNAARAVAAAAAPPLRANSPPKEGPLREIDTWGLNVGRAWAEGLMAGATDGSALGGLRGMLSGSPGGGGMVPAVAGGVVVHVSYSPGLSTASPAEMDQAARTLGPAIVRELRSRGLVPAGSY